jgi:thioredoxin 1
MKTIVRNTWVAVLFLGMSLFSSSCQNSSLDNEVITKESFMNTISEEKLTMVDFYTTWCGPCKMMDPFVKEIKAENSDIVNVLQVDAEAQFDIASQYDIQGYPTVIFFKNGQLVHRAMGAMPKEELLNLVNKFK